MEINAIDTFYPVSSEIPKEISAKFQFFQDCSRLSIDESIFRNISYLPISNEYKEALFNNISRLPFIGLLSLDNPCLYLLEFSSGEHRYFVISQTGYLIDPPHAKSWYPHFKFLSINQENSSYFLGEKNSQLQGTANVDEFFHDKDILLISQTPNFTHFFFDSFGPALILHRMAYLNGDSWSNASYLYGNSFSWQQELLSKLTINSYRVSGNNSEYKFYSFRPKRVLMPIISHHYITANHLRIMFSKQSAPSSNLAKSITKKKIIFFTRCDNRRFRIKNINALERFVQSLGGDVIDPATLNIQQKIELLKDDTVVIAESSGCINFALFSAHSCYLIHLVEPSLTQRDEFIFGGWDYHATYSNPNKVAFVLGSNSEPSIYSPVPACSYSISDINAALSRFGFT